VHSTGKRDTNAVFSTGYTVGGLDALVGHAALATKRMAPEKESRNRSNSQVS
jgi:hypothetical protein